MNKKLIEERKKQRISNAQNILNNITANNASGKPQVLDFSPRAMQQSKYITDNSQHRKSNGSEDIQINYYGINSQQQGDVDMSNDISMKSNLFPFEDHVQQITQLNLNSQSLFANQSNNISKQPTVHHIGNVSERGQNDLSNLLDTKKLEDMNTQTRTATVQNKPIVNSQFNKKQNGPTAFQKKQPRGQQKQGNYSLNQTKFTAANSSMYAMDQTKVNTSNHISQNLLNNSKEMPIYDMNDNNSSVYDEKEKNIHILDEEDPMNTQNANQKSITKRESLFEKAKRKLIPSKSGVEIIGLLCFAFAKLCVSLCTCFRVLSQRFENCVSKIFRNKIGSEILWFLGAIFICWLVFMGVTFDSRDISKSSQFDELKQYISDNIILASFIFIAYGVIFLSIKNWTVYLVLFFVQAVPALVIFMHFIYDTLKLKNRDHIPSPDYIQCAYIFGLYFFWMATYFVVKDLKENYSKTARTFFMLFWCIISAGVIVGYTVYTICTTWNLNFYWGHTYIAVLAGPYIIILAMSWVYMHFKFFEPALQIVPDRSIAADEKQLEQLEKEKQLKKKREGAKVVIPQSDDYNQSLIQKSPMRTQPQEFNEGVLEEQEAEGGAFALVADEIAQKDCKQFNKTFK